MATFGGRGRRPGSSNVSHEGGGQRDIFIKTPVPKDQDRQNVWILDTNPPKLEDGSAGWFNFEQHWDPTARRGWPCARAEGATNCVGCEFPVEDPTDENDRGLNIRGMSSQYIIPVVDGKGYVSLIQFSYGIFETLSEYYDLHHGTLTDRWYMFKRDAATKRYSVLATEDHEAPAVKTSIPDESYIAEAVGRRYLEAMERYGYEGSGFGEVDQPGPDPDPVPGTEPTADAMGEPSSNGWDPAFNAREASTGEMKDWLDSVPESHGGPVKYPAREVRPKLIELVEKTQANLAPF